MKTWFKWLIERVVNYLTGISSTELNQTVLLVQSAEKILLSSSGAEKKEWVLNQLKDLARNKINSKENMNFLIEMAVQIVSKNKK